MLTDVAVEPKRMLAWESENLLVAESFVDERRLADAGGASDVVGGNLSETRRCEELTSEAFEAFEVLDVDDGMLHGDLSNGGTLGKGHDGRLEVGP